MGWVSPTGHNDPDGKWSNETLAYDDDEVTSADSDSVPPQTWSSFLELTHAAIACNKIRFMGWMSGKPAGCDIDLDVYYEADWHHVYQGAFTHLTWLEKDIPAGTKTVTKMRARQYNASAYIDHTFWFHEFDFWEAITVHEVEVLDGIALTDTLVKTPMLFRSDSLALSDVLVKTSIKTLIDGIAFSDAAVVYRTAIKVLTDGIQFTDTLVKTISKTLTDDIAFKDVISYVKNPTKLAELFRKLLQLEGIGGGKKDVISYMKNPTKLAKLIRKLLQLEDIGGGKEG